MSKILVVEEDPNLRLLCQLEFEDDGHEVRAAGDAADAWRYLCTWIPDVAVVEQGLLQESGIDLLRRIVTACLPVRTVIYGTDHVQDEAVLRGADAFVLKSVDLGELKATVRRLLASNPAVLGATDAIR